VCCLPQTQTKTKINKKRTTIFTMVEMCEAILPLNKDPDKNAQSNTQTKPTRSLLSKAVWILSKKEK